MVHRRDEAQGLVGAHQEVGELRREGLDRQGHARRSGGLAHRAAGLDPAREGVLRRVALDHAALGGAAQDHDPGAHGGAQARLVLEERDRARAQRVVGSGQVQARWSDQEPVQAGDLEARLARDTAHLGGAALVEARGIGVQGVGRDLDAGVSAGGDVLAGALDRPVPVGLVADGELQWALHGWGRRPCYPAAARLAPPSRRRLTRTRFRPRSPRPGPRRSSGGRGAWGGRHR